MVVDRNRQIAALEQRGGRLSDAFASRDVHRDERAGDAVERSASAIAPRSVFVWGVTAMEPPYSPSDAC